MRKSVMVMTVVAGILGLGPAAAWASQSLQVGQPPFLFSATYAEPPRLGEPIRLRISFFGFYDESAVSDTRVDVHSGLEVVEGETTLRTSPASQEPWFLSLMPPHPGRYQIHGTIRTVARTHIDEGEFILPIEVRKDALIAGLFQPIRNERIEGGQRFRYGYGYLVPIDEPQQVTQQDIEREDGKPKVLHEEIGICARCGLPGSVAVSYRVLVDERGSARETEALEDQPLPQPVLDAASGALAKWRFKPAKANGFPIRDRLIVEVTVR